jgi:hypothetical protein
MTAPRPSRRYVQRRGRCWGEANVNKRGTAGLSHDWPIAEITGKAPKPAIGR